LLDSGVDELGIGVDELDKLVDVTASIPCRASSLGLVAVGRVFCAASKSIRERGFPSNFFFLFVKINWFDILIIKIIF
jgi:hypothetical protein